MAENLLPGRYAVGTASVDAGGTTVTPTGATWTDNAWVDDLFFLPSQPLVPPQRIESVNDDGEIVLAYPWPGAAAVEEPYEVRFVGIIERSTAQSRKVLEQLGDVKAWYDIIVEDDAARLALESASNPLRSGYRVLVRLDGVIWMKKTSAFGDWEGPVEFKGDKGNKGWSPVYASVVDGERRVEQLVAWVGGEGPAPAGVGKYRGPLGLVDTAAEATDIRGPAGNISGVTPFWQGRITVDADAAAARAGLGADNAANLLSGLLAAARIPDTLTPDKAFRRGNILATVLQSGGVPTGGILERGSNANGQYVRFADGTQICWKFTIVNRTIVSASGSVFFDFTAIGGGTLPASVAALADSTFGAIVMVASPFGAEVMTNSNSNTFLNFPQGAVWSTVSRPAADFTIGLFHIGRWF